ncbi:MULTISPECIES: hypothetical protein [Wolbachia]|uniref:Uncharacterized protein n=1 Tax=Wolbachia pipientis TaxID=955 RepID=A0A7G5CE00_WOLPI|nr:MULTISPECIES: hypothetical protein [Wolbachia]MDE5060573.1 hypothetical protein [Wolbachia endosymbiont of Drosophila nikananu]QMV47434.1 hypothetical protein HC356_05625 [Wolbachia pipientis]
MSILRRLLRINSNTPEVKEAIGFNPTNVELIEGNGVAYELSYQDNGNGSSKVKLLISPLYQSKTYECGTNISVANEFKDQLSLTLIEDSAEIDKVGVIFPEEGIGEEGEKYVKGLSFHTYGIKQSINVPSVEHLDKRKLQKNINNGSPANVGNSYFQPRAAKVDNGDVIVIAHNLKDQTLVSWYLKSDKGGKFKVLNGEKGVTERKLFNFDNPGQLALNGNTMLYSQVSRKIIGDQEVRKTHIFKFDMAKVVEDLKSEKKDECLLGKKNCQINTASSITSNLGKINFLQYVEGGDLVAFLAEDRLPNKQTLHLTSLVKNGSKSNFTVCEFADSIEQLYVKDNGQDSFIVTAISEENVAIFNHQRFEKPSKVTIIPASSIKTLSDFVNIINGRLTPDIISSSTVAPVTITETVVTSKQASTAAIASTAETDTVKTTKLTTEASTTAAPTTMSKPSTTQTSTVTVKPTTVVKTTTTSQATTVATTSTSVPSETETSTVKPTAATVASTSTTSKPSTAQTSTVTVEPTVPTTSSEKTTQTVFIIPSTRTRESITPIFTTALLPQTTSSPQPTQLAIGSNRAGMIGGSLIGTIGIAGIIGFIAYKCIKKYHGYYNTAHVLELADLESHSNSSNEEIFFTHSRTSSDNNISIQTTYQSETMLNSISVESSSRARSSSSSSSSGPSS